MYSINRIHQIGDEYFDQEMDSWYFGPCDEIYELAKPFSDKEWGQLIESTKITKPDMWRVLLTHAFFEHEKYVGRSEEFIIFQASKCEDPDEAYLIVQYVDDFNWKNLPAWLLQLFISKLDMMSVSCFKDCRPYLVKLKDEVNAACT